MLDKMSARTGVRSDPLELPVTLPTLGTDMETLENGLRVMQKTLTEASQVLKGQRGSRSARADGWFGPGQALPDEQFKLLADRISQIQDPLLRPRWRWSSSARPGPSSFRS